jgi:GxxExxY protein
VDDRDQSKSLKGHKFEPLSYAVFGACIEVQRQMGVHCMEVGYQRALERALKKRGLEYQREAEIPVAFDGEVVTTRRVDFLIWDDKDEILLETKARSMLLPEDTEQCLLYLYQGRYRVCLLANFGEKPLGPRGMASWRGATQPHGEEALCVHPAE